MPIADTIVYSCLLAYCILPDLKSSRYVSRFVPFSKLRDYKWNMRFIAKFIYICAEISLIGHLKQIISILQNACLF